MKGDHKFEAENASPPPPIRKKRKEKRKVKTLVEYGRISIPNEMTIPYRDSKIQFIVSTVT